ncbi:MULTISPECIES: FAD-dependent monooxygenase [Rhizobium]|uniref:2-polyprenyl-6-methoxyphenol hydroxylase-like FAD-dependent oxidoreductase n=1 Tax=Rhizobium tropici TaxID=398 RepID=A0A6P1C9X5_RHITR|nr:MULTISPECIES: FAD-dependent monooxygenase [Rhizobium]AGB74400.1 monooxygenase FAD-binding protein [Rhizobium tropici CIAT 899]MBB4240882.1 2-polyprenyl-6-methoxyphenol hydroxylase-like FAD-dependent oxidoreductase [Rhizobium tropici]MBB5591702.1 2-polyprenyl-6-methoxyphenol hydroxylase-like FAD-dependent oxidoreductase [Rhizobium tropici]MBB6490755.1 2-polyprenyl-6-methoxyphenol hydroxylase-like FAD-dependent oxidoreductase [Rhizobium tropici]NEV12235.1 monooxygenase [Rhizobium tropici]
MLKDIKILVLGGGIAGMAASIALRDRGIAVDLCERDPQWKVYGAGITITGPTLRAMGRLGILDEVLEEGYAADGIDICSAQGKHLFTVDTTNEALGGIPSAGGILRPVLHHIMQRRLQKIGVAPLLGVEVESIVSGKTRSQVRFGNGKVAEYDLIVGADGIYSETRTRLFPQTSAPRYAGQLCWRLMTERHPSIGRRTFFLGGRAKVGLNPVSKNQMYMFYLEAQREPLRRDEAGQHQILHDLMEGYGGVLAEVRQALKETSNIICRPLETVFVDGNWSNGNVVLIGDAAHATTPQLASGAGMGIEDGLVLAQEVSKAPDVATALDAFMSRRYGRCKLVVDSSLEISRLEREQAAPEAQTAVVEKALVQLNQEF